MKYEVSKRGVNLKKILIATKNEGKAQEYRKMFEAKGFSVVTLLDLDPNKVPQINENGKSFEENALIKAQTLTDSLNIPALADDSGLYVDVLNGEPGIYSARYAGDHDDQANRQKLLMKMQDVPTEQRTAHFHTSIVVTRPGSKPLSVAGEAQGRILESEHGEGGFGYDPLFYSFDLKKSFAEASMDEKNSVSHRGNAVRKLMKNFDQWWSD